MRDEDSQANQWQNYRYQVAQADADWEQAHGRRVTATPTMPPFLARPLKAFFGAAILGTVAATLATIGIHTLLWQLFGLFGTTPPAPLIAGLLNGGNAYIPLTGTVLGCRWWWRGRRNSWPREILLTLLILCLLAPIAIACGFLFGSAVVTEGVAKVVGP